MKKIAGFYNQLIYILFVNLVCISFIAFLLIFSIKSGSYFQLLFNGGILIYIMIMWSIRISKMPIVKSISYDKEQFFIQLKNMEIIVPFADTNGIGIKTLDGIFELELSNPSQVGKQILFKPSLLYPLNFKKVDQEIERINRMIKKYKRTPALDVEANQLNSFN